MKRIRQILALSFALVVAGCATQKNTQASSSTEPGIYIVQKGDTFRGIAQMHRLTIKQLQDLNPAIMPAHLKAGQKIYVLPHANK